MRWRRLLTLGATCLSAGCSSNGQPASGNGASDAGAEASAELRSDAAVDTTVSTMPDVVEAAAEPWLEEFPRLLSETGLYEDTESDTLAPEARGYEPAYELWSDGATKRRWVILPTGSPIDTSNMDFWEYPEGTKLFKEFTRDGTRVETRMIHKAGPGLNDWVMVAYHWNEDQTDAIAVPEGVENASGTDHDVPGVEICELCHNRMRDRVLGLNALQLSHDRPGVNLAALLDEGALSDPPAASLVIPGDDVARDALGYLHANCGNCHNTGSEIFDRTGVEFWLRADRLGSVEETATYLTALAAFDENLDSAIVQRMSARGLNGQMPPVGSELVDGEGVAVVEAWIDELALTLADAGASDSGGADGGARSDGSSSTDAGSGDAGAN